jgi:hypothetical protein
MAKVASGGQPFSIAAGQQISGDMTIVKVVHIPTTLGDTFLLQDSKGNAVLQGKAQNTGAQPYDFPTPMAVNGLGCASATGVVWIYTA